LKDKGFYPIGKFRGDRKIIDKFFDLKFTLVE